MSRRASFGVLLALSGCAAATPGPAPLEAPLPPPAPARDLARHDELARGLRWILEREALEGAPTAPTAPTAATPATPGATAAAGPAAWAAEEGQP